MLAIYVRVSTQQQAEQGTSLEVQKEMCLEKNKKELGFTKWKIYEEEGVSGEDIDRPKLNELRNDLKSGIITAVLCTHPDRLSRDLTDKLVICREFEKNNVKIYFVDTEYKETPEGQLFFNMQSVIAQYELSLIKKRTTRGRLKVAQQQQILPMRKPPYGYDWKDGKLIINETEAEFVKQIYHWYCYDKLTMRQIGERLTQLGAVPKRQESIHWNASSLRRILTSEVYIGKFYYNRRKTKKLKGEKTEGGNTKKTYSIRDKEEWIEIKVPQIIDEKLFALAQQQKELNKKNSVYNSKEFYLLKSLLRCGYCNRIWQATYYGGNGSTKKQRIYRCPNLYPRNYGASKCKGYIKAEILENHVWDTILKIIENPINELYRNQKTLDSNIEQEKKLLQLYLNKLNKKNIEKERVKNLYIKGLIDEKEMEKDYQKINKEIIELQELIKNYEERIKSINNSIDDTKNLVDIMEVFKKYIDQYKEDISPQKKRIILEKLIDEIRITQLENGKFLLDLQGKIKYLSNDNIETCLQQQEIVNTFNNKLYFNYFIQLYKEGKEWYREEEEGY